MNTLHIVGYHATRESTARYVSDVNPVEFPYVSAKTGELAPNLWYVIRTAIVDMVFYHINHHWMSVKRLQIEVRKRKLEILREALAKTTEEVST